MRVLFVAGLTPVPDGSAGGNVTAATTLFNQGLGEDIELIPLSTTAASNPPPPLTRRAVVAAGRFTRFWRLARTCDAILLFASDGSSFVEKGAMCLAAVALGKPTILRPGGGRLAQQCERSRIFAWWVRVVLRRVTVVTCQTSYWVDFARSMTDGTTCVVEIGNGVSVHSLPGERKRGTLQVGFLGHTTKEKGIFDALSAFQRVRIHEPRARLHVAGGGRDRSQFGVEVERLCLTDHVVFHGWLPRERVGSFLQTLDVLVLPSYAEGLPNALLEAMAVGVPVVATAVGGITDLIRRSGGGILVEPGDVESIARAVTTLLSDQCLADEIGRKGQRFVRERHDVKVVALQYRDAILCALRPSVSGPSTSDGQVGTAAVPSL